jgi:hypothetical protein
MNDPIRRLKYLPWVSLLQVAALTVFFAFVLDTLLAIGFTQVAILQTALLAILSPPWGMLLALAVALAVGALAVYLLERLHPEIIINGGILWALVACVMLMLLLKSLLPMLTFLVSSDYTAFMGVLVGIFWKGRRYWRRW